MPSEASSSRIQKQKQLNQRQLSHFRSLTSGHHGGEHDSSTFVVDTTREQERASGLKGKGKGRADGWPRRPGAVVEEEGQVEMASSWVVCARRQPVLGRRDLCRPLLNLPYTVLPSVLALIPPRQLLPLRLISHTFDDLLDNDTIWRESYINRFIPPGLTAAAAEQAEKTTRRDDTDEEGRADRLGLVRSCVGTGAGAGGLGWKREALSRESMLERFTTSRATTTVHSPHIDLIHALALFYTPPQPPAMRSAPGVKGRATSLFDGGHPHALSPGSPAHTAASPGSAPATPTPAGPKIIGAKSRQPHRLEAANGGATGGQGRAPHVVSMGMNAGVAIRSDPLTGKCMPGMLGAGQISSLQSIDRVPTCVSVAPLNPTCALWGLRSGHVVHSTLLNPLPAPGRLVGPSVACDREACHMGPVRCIHMPEANRSRVTDTDSYIADTFASGGDDGCVKLWRHLPAEKKSGVPLPGLIELVWTSDPVPRSTAAPSSHIVGVDKQEGSADEISLVKCHPSAGVVVAATVTGRVWVWTGLHDDVSPIVARRVFPSITGPKTPPTFLDSVIVEDQDDEGAKRTLQIVLHASGSAEIARIDCSLDADWDRRVDQVTYLTTGRDAPIISVHTEFKLPPSISLPTSLVPAGFAARVAVASGATTPLTEDESVFTGTSTPVTRDVEPLSRAEGYADSRFVLAGGEDGQVHIWDWDMPPTVQPANDLQPDDRDIISPIVSWQAGEGPITTVTAARSLIATGSFDGLIKIWDPLDSPPSLLRTVRNRHSNPPATYPALGTPLAQNYSVNHIVLESDMVVATIGPNVLGWRAGSSKGKDSKSAWKGQVLGKHSAGKTSPAKGYDQKEMRQVVDESKKQIEAEQDVARAVNEQNNAVRAHYDELGFDSTDEALQYALMMSKEETPHVSREDREMQQALDAIYQAEQEGVASGSGRQGQPSVEDVEAAELADALEQIRIAEQREMEDEVLRRSLEEQ